MTIASLLCTSALLGGCGAGDADRLTQPSQPSGMTHDQYQQALYRIVSGDDSREATRLFFDAVATEYETKPCADKVDQLHKRLRSILVQVEDLHPPADAAGSQRDFLAAAQESVRLVGVAAEDIAHEQLSCGRPLNSRIYGMPSTARAEAALAKLKGLGYVVFGD
ncbi:MAG: hypothetical protein H0V92_07795 [Pseudonocardiales bacterium]|nr:hypothetical protein [Pseudonocardiales bacterium]